MKRDWVFWILLIGLVVSVAFLTGDLIVQAAPPAQVEPQTCDHVFTSDGVKMYRCYDEDFDVVCYTQGWIPFCMQP
jgi:hypothetical protein